MGLHKIIKIVALIIGVVGTILLAMIWIKGDEAIKDAGGEGVDGFIYVAYIIFALVLAFVMVFVLKGLAAGNIKKTLITIGAFLGVVLISFVLANGSIKGLPLVDGVAVTESSSKWVGTGLYSFYILTVVAIGAMVFSGIKKISN